MRPRLAPMSRSKENAMVHDHPVAVVLGLTLVGATAVVGAFTAIWSGVARRVLAL